jgi:hypothetical protein
LFKCSITYFTISRSKLLKYYPLVISETSYPIPLKNPAIYTPTYPPPTTKVLPGGVFLKKISSLVIARCAPSISR